MQTPQMLDILKAINEFRLGQAKADAPQFGLDVESVQEILWDRGFDASIGEIETIIEYNVLLQEKILHSYLPQVLTMPYNVGITIHTAGLLNEIVRLQEEEIKTLKDRIIGLTREKSWVITGAVAAIIFAMGFLLVK